MYLCIWYHQLELKPPKCKLSVIIISCAINCMSILQFYHWETVMQSLRSTAIRYGVACVAITALYLSWRYGVPRMARSGARRSDQLLFHTSSKQVERTIDKLPASNMRSMKVALGKNDAKRNREAGQG